MADEETTPILLVFVGSRIDSNGTGLDDYWLLPKSGAASPANSRHPTLQRIQELRTELEAERISYGELHEIDCAADEAGITVTDEMLAGDILDELEALAK